MIAQIQSGLLAYEANHINRMITLDGNVHMYLASNVS